MRQKAPVIREQIFFVCHITQRKDNFYRLKELTKEEKNGWMLLRVLFPGKWLLEYLCVRVWTSLEERLKMIQKRPNSIKVLFLCH